MSHVDDDDAFERGKRIPRAEDLPDAEPPTAAPTNTAPRNAFAERWTTIGDNWFDEPPPPIDWILRRPTRPEIPGDDGGYLPAGHVGTLVAPGGVGKSMALLQLGISIATGEPWLDYYEVPRSGRVLLAFGEEDADEVRRRLFRMTQVLLASDVAQAQKDPHAAARRRLALQSAIYENVALLPLAGESVAFMKVERDGSATPTPAYDSFRELVQAKGPWRMIVLDPLSRFAGPDTETNNAAATQFITAVEQLARLEFGSPCVMLAHHSNKSSRKIDQQADASNARGSTGLTDGVRWAAELRTHFGEDEQRTEKVELSMTKFNRGAWAPKIILSRQAGGVLKFDSHAGTQPKVSTSRGVSATAQASKSRVLVESSGEGGETLWMR